MVMTKAQRSAAAKKAAQTKAKIRQSKIAEGAARTNKQSEEKFVRRLLKKKFLTFRTGTQKGIPDIVAYKGKKLSFYEIKPSQSGSGVKKLFLKSQSDWVKKFCFGKKVDINLVYYKISGSYKYHVISITRKNISDFVDTKKNRKNIKQRIKKFSFK